MSGRVLARLVPALLLAASLTACGGDGEPDSSATAETSSPAESASPSESGSESELGSESDGAAEEPGAATITVTREGDTFTPNGERVELAVGETLVLTIDADEAGEIHVHSTPEQDITYGAGTSEHEITVDRPGVVEVESHDPDIVLLQLEVR